jgi:hypothetical protein
MVRTLMRMAFAVVAGLALGGLPMGGAVAQTGNGAPSGPHFILNLIGRRTALTTDNSGGSVIFVWQNGGSKIYLSPGPFQVLDNNATDANGGAFQLPGPTTSGTFTYTVWLRVVGTPGGTGKITTEAYDPVSKETIASLNSKLTMRSTGHSKFQNVSNELLYITYVNSLGQTVTVPLFDSSLQNYFWQYDNMGQKIVQLRFYQQ